MENKKKKSSAFYMAMSSLIIVILGFICSVSFYYDVTSQMNISDSVVLVDGADLSGFISLMGQMGALIISVLIFIASLLAVGIQWIVYFIVKFVKKRISAKYEPRLHEPSELM